MMHCHGGVVVLALMLVMFSACVETVKGGAVRLFLSTAGIEQRLVVEENQHSATNAKAVTPAQTVVVVVVVWGVISWVL
jgi:hypothetical protein